MEGWGRRENASTDVPRKGEYSFDRQKKKNGGAAKKISYFLRVFFTRRSNSVSLKLRRAHRHQPIEIATYTFEHARLSWACCAEVDVNSRFDVNLEFTSSLPNSTQRLLLRRHPEAVTQQQHKSHTYTPRPHNSKKSSRRMRLGSNNVRTRLAIQL